MGSTCHAAKPVDVVKRIATVKNKDGKKEKTQIEISRPNTVAQYNIGMGGVDLADQHIAHYRCSRKAMR